MSKGDGTKKNRHWGKIPTAAGKPDFVKDRGDTGLVGGRMEGGSQAEEQREGGEREERGGGTMMGRE